MVQIHSPRPLFFSAMRSFMLPVGFSFSSFSRMREPFVGTMLRYRLKFKFTRPDRSFDLLEV